MQINFKIYEELKPYQGTAPLETESRFLNKWFEFFDFMNKAIYLAKKVKRNVSK